MQQCLLENSGHYVCIHYIKLHSASGNPTAKHEMKIINYNNALGLKISLFSALCFVEFLSMCESVLQRAFLWCWNICKWFIITYENIRLGFSVASLKLRAYLNISKYTSFRYSASCEVNIGTFILNNLYKVSKCSVEKTKCDWYCNASFPFAKYNHWVKSYPIICYSTVQSSLTIIFILNLKLAVNRWQV